MDYTSFFNYQKDIPLIGSSIGVTLILLLAVWELAWKGWALWRAAKNNDNVWFVVLLVLNTVGILPILYIYLFSKKK